MDQTKLTLTAEQNAGRRIYNLIDIAMGEDLIALSFFEVENETDQWQVELYVPTSEVETFAARVQDCLGGDFFGLNLQREAVPDRDWITQSLEGLKPVRAGRFLVHGDHDRASVQPHDIAIEINAGQAFGTGHHGTTAGCLDMLEWLLKRTCPRCALDVGTGSGVLAIGLAKLAQIPIIASDIDPVATMTARTNCALNGVSSQVTCVTATGFNHNAFRNQGPVPLIIANILSGPLAKLAPDMELYLEHGGHIVLSGLLPHQRARILAAYRAQGLYHLKTHYRDGWMTLVLQG